MINYRETYFNLPLNLHTYADGIQLYLLCNDNPSESPNIISSEIDTIHKWLSINSLAFNLGKTEALFLQILYRITPLCTPSPIICNETIIPYSSEIQVSSSTLSSASNRTKSIQYQLHSQRIVRRSISTETAITIASSYILPIFNYCNFTLQNMPQSSITIGCRNYKTLLLDASIKQTQSQSPPKIPVSTLITLAPSNIDFHIRAFYCP